jgi:cytochrome b
MTHWGVAAGVLANGVFTEGGSELHQWIGYGLAALLALRWIWGLVGAPEARFSAFPPSLGRAAAHIQAIRRGDKTPHRSHNPLGALMVYALWAALAVVIGSGIAMAGLPGVEASPAQASASAPPFGSTVAGEDEARESREDHEARESHESDEDEGAGEGEELMEEVHEVAANVLFVLAGLHILGVAFETRRSGRGILMAMMPGGRGGRTSP